jgi:hypothetical protein
LENACPEAILDGKAGCSLSPMHRDFAKGNAPRRAAGAVATFHDRNFATPTHGMHVPMVRHV